MESKVQALDLAYSTPQMPDSCHQNPPGLGSYQERNCSARDVNENVLDELGHRWGRVEELVEVLVAVWTMAIAVSLYVLSGHFEFCFVQVFRFFSFFVENLCFFVLLQYVVCLLAPVSKLARLPAMRLYKKERQFFVKKERFYSRR